MSQSMFFELGVVKLQMNSNEILENLQIVGNQAIYF